MGKQTSFQTHCCREGPLKCRRNVGHTLISRVARSGLNTVFVLAMRQPDGLAENSRCQTRRYRITPDNDFLPDGVVENCVRHVITQIPSPCPAPTVTRGPTHPRNKIRCATPFLECTYNKINRWLAPCSPPTAAEVRSQTGSPIAGSDFDCQLSDLRAVDSGEGSIACREDGGSDSETRAPSNAG